MGINDRYHSAVHSGNLRSNPDTTNSDSDILGAVGLAAKERPLGMALMRLLSGDNHAAGAVVEILAEQVWRLAISRDTNPTLKRAEAHAMAMVVLSWYRRDNPCPSCGGHGYMALGQIGLGTTALTDRPCPACKGEGRKPLAFVGDRLDLARDAAGMLEAELAESGAAAMRKLAPRLDL